MTLDSRVTYIAINEDIPGLKSEIEQACTGGGAFVDIHLAGNRIISVLITPSSRVTFEEVEVPDAEGEDGAPENFFDGDYWFDTP